jgi:glycosyltransferase involved in cell wall biosynthesis
LPGIQSDKDAELHGIAPEQCRFVRFEGADLPFAIPGMTDIMPYPSTRFVDLTASERNMYETAFARVLTETVADFQPHIIHSHHLWLVSSLARRLFPQIPVVATCHGTDLRQFQNCPHLRRRVLSGCRDLDAALALSAPQAADIAQLYQLLPERVTVVGAGFSDTLFKPGEKAAPPPVQVVYAGKLWNAKGLPWLLKALKTIAIPEWQLHLVGGGKRPGEGDLPAFGASAGGACTHPGPGSPDAPGSHLPASPYFCSAVFVRGPAVGGAGSPGQWLSRGGHGSARGHGSVGGCPQ